MNQAPGYTTLYPRRHNSSQSPLWKRQIQYAKLRLRNLLKIVKSENKTGG
jgi:hypothetical protein